MNLSQYALERMRYQRRHPDEPIEAEFSSLHVFTVQGVSLNGSWVIRSSGSIAGSRYEISLATSINSASQALVGEDFCENEIEWQTQNNCTPPFLLIVVGPTRQHAITGDFVKIGEDVIDAYDAFPAAKAELREIEDRTLPAVLSSLACTFNETESTVTFKKLAQETFGKTEKGTMVRDYEITMQGTLSTARLMEADDATNRLARAQLIASSMNPKVSKFFT